MTIPNLYAAHNGTAFSCDYLSSRPCPWISHSGLAGILQGSLLPGNICKSNVMLLAIRQWLSKILHGEYRTHQHPAVAPRIREVLPLSCMGLLDGALLARNRMTSDRCWWQVIVYNFSIRNPTHSTVTLILGVSMSFFGHIPKIKKIFKRHLRCKTFCPLLSPFVPYHPLSTA